MDAKGGSPPVREPAVCIPKRRRSVRRAITASPPQPQRSHSHDPNPWTTRPRPLRSPPRHHAARLAARRRQCADGPHEPHEGSSRTDARQGLFGIPAGHGITRPARGNAHRGARRIRPQPREGREHERQGEQIRWTRPLAVLPHRSRRRRGFEARLRPRRK